MFKKRVIKSNDSDKIASGKSGKRPLFSDEEEEGDRSNTSIDRTDLHSNDVFKKRQKWAISKKPQPLAVAVVPNDNITTTNDRADEELPVITTKSHIKPLPTNITVTTLTDFQPDVCKDFLQTGYCGYGDTCKFLHIRDESKANKVIEKEWETVGTNAVKPKSSFSANTNNTDIKEKLPFKCVLCKSDYKSPIKTKCGHIFCKDCYLERYQKKKKSNCYICGQDTNGILMPISKSQLAKLTN